MYRISTFTLLIYTIYMLGSFTKHVSSAVLQSTIVLMDCSSYDNSENINFDNNTTSDEHIKSTTQSERDKYDLSSLINELKKQVDRNPTLVVDQTNTILNNISTDSESLFDVNHLKADAAERSISKATETVNRAYYYDIAIKTYRELTRIAANLPINTTQELQVQVSCLSGEIRCAIEAKKANEAIPLIINTLERIDLEPIVKDIGYFSLEELIGFEVMRGHYYANNWKGDWEGAHKVLTELIAKYDFSNKGKAYFIILNCIACVKCGDIEEANTHINDAMKLIPRSEFELYFTALNEHFMWEENLAEILGISISNK